MNNLYFDLFFVIFGDGVGRHFCDGDFFFLSSDLSSNIWFYCCGPSSDDIEFYDVNGTCWFSQDSVTGSSENVS